MNSKTKILAAIGGFAFITAVAIYFLAPILWAQSLLSQDNLDLSVQVAESDALNLYQNIVSTSNSGSGAESTIELENSYKTKLNQDGNYLELSLNSSSSPYPNGRWTLLSGVSRQGLSFGSGSYAVKSKHKTGVLAVKSEKISNKYHITYRIEFRDMSSTGPSGARLEKIELSGKEDLGSTIEISNQGTSTERVSIRSEELPRIKKKINLE